METERKLHAYKDRNENYSQYSLTVDVDHLHVVQAWRGGTDHFIAMNLII